MMMMMMMILKIYQVSGEPLQDQWSPGHIKIPYEEIADPYFCVPNYLPLRSKASSKNNEIL